MKCNPLHTHVQRALLRKTDEIFIRHSHADCLVEQPPLYSLRVDALGRWLAVRLDGVLYRRVLDGRIVTYPEQWATPKDVGDLDDVHRQVQCLAARFHDSIAQREMPIRWNGSLVNTESVVSLLAAVQGWNASRFADEHSRFRRAYDEDVEILPPDRYNDVVVLPATGCPNSECTFCAFYRDRPLQPKSTEAFASHLDDVAAFLGPALPLRSGVFLGSASALSLSQRRLLEVLKTTALKLGHFPRGVGAFWDPDHAPRRSIGEWQTLGAAGLSHAYVGLETGSSDLRRGVKKSGDVSSLTQTLQSFLRSSTADHPLHLGLMVLVGIGGPESVKLHREETTALLSQLELSKKDIVYLSPLKGSLPTEQLDAETARLKELARTATAARVSSYAMDAFRYYA